MKTKLREMTVEELDAALLDRVHWIRARAALKTSPSSLRAEAMNQLLAEYVRLLGAASLATRQKLLRRLIGERDARRIAAMLE